MSVKKKILSVVCAAAAALSAMSFSGCADVSWAMEIDGQSIASGVYIIYSGYGLSMAQSKLSEEQPDLDTSAEGFDYYDQTVSEMSFGDYVRQETENYCKRHIALQAMQKELGVELSDSEKQEISDAVNNQWDYDVTDWTSTFTYLSGCDTMGAYYESIGISKASFKEVMTISYLADDIFQYYYGEGGVEEVPQEDITNYIDENYTLARYFSISITDDDGNVIESNTELALIEKQAQEYVDLLNSGEAYKDVYAKYQDDQSEDEESEDTDEDASDEETDEDTEEEAEDETQDSDYDRFIARTSTSPTEEFVEALFEQEKNTAAIFKADTYYYVVQRLDITENEEYLEEYKDTALDALKGDEMDDVIKDYYASYEVKKNDSAPDYVSQQAENAKNAISTIASIQFYQSYYSSLYSS